MHKNEALFDLFGIDDSWRVPRRAGVVGVEQHRVDKVSEKVPEEIAACPDHQDERRGARRFGSPRCLVRRAEP